MEKQQPAPPRDALMPEGEVVETIETIETIKKEKKKEEPMASVSETFSFVFACGPKVRLTFFIGCFAGILNGLVYPALAWIFSTSFSSIAGAANGLDPIREIAYIFLGVGAYALIAATVQSMCFEICAHHASRSFRLQWFKALLRQDCSFFDVYDVSGVAATIGGNSSKYRRGIGEKFGEFLQYSTNFVGGLVFAFYSCWQVALVVLAVLPVVGLTGLAAVKINTTKSASAAAAYSKAGSVAYSTVSAIKTVLSLNAIPEMIKQYSAATREAFEQAKKLLWKAGFANGSMLGSFILLYCILCLFGTFLIWRDVEPSDGSCDPSDSALSYLPACPNSGADVFGAMLGVAFAAQGVSQLGNFFGIFTEARVACHAALQAIHRTAGSPEEDVYEKETKDEDKTERAESDIESGETEEKKLRAILPAYEIDSSSPYGLKPPNPRGAISFQNVHFHYPTRPSENILDGFNLEIEAGKTVALVGASGGGKSTTVAMIERFYDPQEGSVSLDGINIKDINVNYLRSIIGYVGQEPTLFATTIAGNIKYGCPQATQQQVEEAARLANAHDFISSFPDGYTTQCGDKGTQLSGGQKQRIAIARVLISDPQILLLDEATSALDSESELIVQEALDDVLAKSNKRTTVVIAHRLSTIRNADTIAVCGGGRVLEQGTHDELLAKEGHYSKLVDAQERRPTGRFSVVSREGSIASSGNNSYADLKDLQAIGIEVEDIVSALATPHFEFKGVSFSYPTRPKKQILDDFNLTIRRGETIGLVGPSGGGKSTVISMIERFYDPTGGTVEYLGNDIRTLNLKWYRDQIGYVGQEPVLFSASIGKNIAYGAPGATRAEIEEAARQANAYDFIMSFPNGFETEVGERGTQLSGGQKQRVAIARALVKKPNIILLDEATSALDSESESIVQEALDRLMESKDHTTVVIAHRLSTIRHCDKIAFVADGVVKEFGSHDELLDRNHGRYKRLWEAQTRRASVANNVFGSNSKSFAEGEEEKPDFETEIEEAEKNAFDAKRARQMAQPDSLYVAIGAVGAVIAGGVFPAWGIMFGETINLLFRVVPKCEEGRIILPTEDTEETISLTNYTGGAFEECDDFFQYVADDMRQQSFVLGGYWVAIAVGCIVGQALTFYGFGMASERLNKRVRDTAFTALVRQEVAFYDKRSVGKITSELEDDAARIHTFSGEPIRSLLTAVSSLVIGLVVSFIFMWQFALLAVGCIPVMGAATSIEMKKMYGEEDSAGDGQDELNSPGGIAVETLINIRTVAALTLENQRYIDYENALDRDGTHYVRDGFLSGLSSGFSMGIQQWVNALQMWFGGWILFTNLGVYTLNDFLISMFSLLFSLFGLGAAFQGISDKKETEASAGRVFYLLDRKSEIDPMSEEGKKLD